MMYLSRILFGAGCAERTALLASLSVRIPGSCRVAAACVLLVVVGACSARDDGGAAKGDMARGVASAVVARSAAATPVAASAAGTHRASAEVYAGWRNFNINCQSCHGLDAVASDVAPDLRNSVRKGGTVTHVQFREVVRKGRMAKGMPAWGALLDSTQIEQIYAYLLARSSGALGAGRPEVGGE